MADSAIQHLRVLIANERRERLELLAQVVAGLGHEVIAREIHVKRSGRLPRESGPTSRWSGSGWTPSMHST